MIKSEKWPADNNDQFTKILSQYSLLNAFVNRRSRRFGKGFNLNGGALAYQSSEKPQSLNIFEEAALAFAGCGITGYALAELPFENGGIFEAGGGNIMVHLIGRTVPSGDAVHAVSLFVINDEGVWLLKRPQDYLPDEIPELIQQSKNFKLLNLYNKSRIKISGVRLDVPREVPMVPPFNKWSANLPGTTCFLPVNELTALYINVLLSAFSEEYACYIVDERKNFRSAGLSKFAKSNGGYLNDDPKNGRIAGISFTENWIHEFAAIEQGAVLQNLGLMAEALNLGGFSYFAAHPYIWFKTLGFRMEQISVSKITGMNLLMKAGIKLAGKDFSIPFAVGFEYRKEVLIKPFCPPYYKNMEEAVLAFVDYKYNKDTGTLRNSGDNTGWKNSSSIKKQIPKYSDQTIAAAISYCEYVFNTYGRFPSSSGPFRSILAYQAHKLDYEFYTKFFNNNHP